MALRDDLGAGPARSVVDYIALVAGCGNPARSEPGRHAPRSPASQFAADLLLEGDGFELWSRERKYVPGNTSPAPADEAQRHRQR